jgi:hypothetical protein
MAVVRKEISMSKQADGVASTPGEVLGKVGGLVGKSGPAISAAMRTDKVRVACSVHF